LDPLLLGILAIQGIQVVPLGPSFLGILVIRGILGVLGVPWVLGVRMVLGVHRVRELDHNPYHHTLALEQALERRHNTVVYRQVHMMVHIVLHRSIVSYQRLLLMTVHFSFLF